MPATETAAVALGQLGPGQFELGRQAGSKAHHLDAGELAQGHSRRLGGGRRWVAVGRTGERLDLAATP
ncbi:MAG: hypothetical protein ACKOOH_07260 [Cyanobium sp.]